MAPVRGIGILLTLGHCLAFTACALSSHAGKEDAVVPTPPVLTGGDDQTTRIGARALLVTYQGAKHAPADVKRSKPEAQQRATMVASIARMSGQDFAELALKYGDRPILPEEGGAGVLIERGNGLLDAKVEAEAFSLSIHEASGPIETDAGFVIVQRTQTPAAAAVEIGARHILIAYAGAQRAAPNVTRSKEEAEALATEIGRQVRDGKDWETLWQEHSNEPGGRPGGDLGMFAQGQMVPAFEQAAFGLAIGQTSDIVETPFGYHVIQRTR
jgi:parvulin-like peptidyl-prolyl isomerase